MCTCKCALGRACSRIYYDARALLFAGLQVGRPVSFNVSLGETAMDVS